MVPSCLWAGDCRNVSPSAHRIWQWPAFFFFFLFLLRPTSWRAGERREERRGEGSIGNPPSPSDPGAPFRLEKSLLPPPTGLSQCTGRSTGGSGTGSARLPLAHLPWWERFVFGRHNADLGDGGSGQSEKPSPKEGPGDESELVLFLRGCYAEPRQPRCWRRPPLPEASVEASEAGVLRFVPQFSFP